ncbi:MAG: TetR/AcrR family transcriptional regulator [Actinomycetota bacterium]|nr:TetR/AcrR family transcriptional regulator [Actinomycetota bacterium]
MSASSENRPAARSRAEVATAALALIDEEGLAGLSMRRLAQRLGVGTMTLYGWFRSKDELLHAVVEVAADGPPPHVPEGDWRDALRAIARQWRRSLERHPALVELRLRRPITTPAAFASTEAGLQALLAAGFDRAGAARAFRTLFVYVFGYAAFSDPELTPELRARVDGALAALPPGEFPVLSASREEMAATLAGDEQFEDGLEAILAGLAARVERAPLTGRTRRSGG